LAKAVVIPLDKNSLLCCFWYWYQYLSFRNDYPKPWNPILTLTHKKKKFNFLFLLFDFRIRSNQRTNEGFRNLRKTKTAHLFGRSSREASRRANREFSLDFQLSEKMGEFYWSKLSHKFGYWWYLKQKQLRNNIHHLREGNSWHT
jgi:hypothetical protein